MALAPNNAVRIEHEIADHRSGPYLRKLWIFECVDCGKEMRKQSGALKTHTGKCVRCVKRNRHRYQTVYNTFVTGVRRTNERLGREVEVSLTFDEFVFLTQICSCAYCGAEVKWAEYKSGPSNLDRKDNDKGYEMGNVLVCCFQCNRIKSDHFSTREFHAIQKLLRIFREGKEIDRKQLEYSLYSYSDEWSLV